jgi:hypothetical protein
MEYYRRTRDVHGNITGKCEFCWRKATSDLDYIVTVYVNVTRKIALCDFCYDRIYKDQNNRIKHLIDNGS